MLTWKLWRALHDPPVQHPLFGHISRVQPSQLGRLTVFLLPLGLAFMLAVFILGVWRSPPLITTPLLNSHSVALIVLLVFTGTVYGLVWASNISHILMRMRAEGKYDLLRLSTSSELQLNWAICTGYLYRNQSFSRVHTQRARITQYMLMIPAGLAMPLMLGIASENEPYVLMILTTFVHAVVIALAYYLDYAQSVIIGGLLGMSVPSYVRTEFDARTLAAGGFLAVQIGSYGITWLIGFVVLPELYTAWHISGSYAELSLAVARLLVFYLVREALILGLWSLLLRQLPARV